MLYDIWLSIYRLLKNITAEILYYGVYLMIFDDNSKIIFGEAILMSTHNIGFYEETYVVGAH